MFSWSDRWPMKVKVNTWIYSPDEGLPYIQAGSSLHSSWTPEPVKKRSVSRWACKNKRHTNSLWNLPDVRPIVGIQTITFGGMLLESVWYFPFSTAGRLCVTIKFKEVYYESIKREPKIRGINKCRCDERLQTKTKEFTRLPYNSGKHKIVSLMCFYYQPKKGCNNPAPTESL